MLRNSSHHSIAAHSHVIANSQNLREKTHKKFLKIRFN